MKNLIFILFLAVLTSCTVYRPQISRAVDKECIDIVDTSSWVIITTTIPVDRQMRKTISHLPGVNRFYKPAGTRYTFSIMVAKTFNRQDVLTNITRVCCAQTAK